MPFALLEEMHLETGVGLPYSLFSKGRRVTSLESGDSLPTGVNPVFLSSFPPQVVSKRTIADTWLSVPGSIQGVF